MAESEIRYCTTDDGVRIAYCVEGVGPPIVRLTGPIMYGVHHQFVSLMYGKLLKRRRVVTFDPRGTGLSEREVHDISLETALLDLEAVANSLDLGLFTIHGIGLAAVTAITYAERFPGRVSHLILDDAFVSGTEVLDVPQNRALRELLISDWNGFTDTLAFLTFGRGRDETQIEGAAIREEVGQQTAIRIINSLMGADVRPLLPLVRMPALVLRHMGDGPRAMDVSRRLTGELPDARMVTLRGLNADGMEQLQEAIANFLGDESPNAGSDEPTAFRTILFTDVVQNTDLLARIGDDAWHTVMREHEAIVRQALKDHGGTEISTAGDGFFASFTSATRALQCAIETQRTLAARNAIAQHPVEIRVGLNAGEPIEDGDDLMGTAVTLAARIMGQATAGQILTSDVIRQLVAGKTFMFDDRGDFVPKGFTDPIRLHEVRWRE